MDNENSLIDLISLDALERIQDHFAAVLHVTIRTVDREGNLITRPSTPSRLCERILTESPAGITKCGRCLPVDFGDLSRIEQWRDGYQCYLGLYSFCIPVIVSENEVIAYILLGPVFLGQRREANQYTRKAEELGIPLEGFIDCLSEIKLFTFTGIRSVIDLISDIVCNVAQLGYSRLKLERIIPLPRIGKVVHKFHMDKILTALLDVSFNTPSLCHLL